jgi:NADH-quinone oxidoreductase subunit J
MTLAAVSFYAIAALIVITTATALTRPDPLHAVLWLVLSFFGSALLFFLLGAPLLAALEVIIYAGAVMILFLFMVMMLRADPEGRRPPLGRLVPLALLGTLGLAAGGVLLAGVAGVPLALASLAPAALGRYLFQQHALAVEIVSLLLLVALVGALLLARSGPEQGGRP